jgi:pentatricopeptide repeat protein
MGVMTAHAKRGIGEASALRTEELLEEMESAGDLHPGLKPTSVFVNVVLSAWSRSRSAGAIERCKAFLSRMEALALNDRPELAPSTVTFNTVIDAMARRNKANEGEELLVKMDELSQKHFEWDCEPDSISFNTVLKGWAKVS